MSLSQTDAARGLFLRGHSTWLLDAWLPSLVLRSHVLVLPLGFLRWCPPWPVSASEPPAPCAPGQRGRLGTLPRMAAGPWGAPGFPTHAHVHGTTTEPCSTGFQVHLCSPKPEFPGCHHAQADFSLLCCEPRGRDESYYRLPCPRHLSAETLQEQTEGSGVWLPPGRAAQLSEAKSHIQPDECFHTHCLFLILCTFVVLKHHFYEGKKLHLLQPSLFSTFFALLLACVVISPQLLRSSTPVLSGRPGPLLQLRGVLLSVTVFYLLNFCVVLLQILHFSLSNVNFSFQIECPNLDCFSLLSDTLSLQSDWYSNLSSSCRPVSFVSCVFRFPQWCLKLYVPTWLWRRLMAAIGTFLAATTADVLLKATQAGRLWISVFKVAKGKNGQRSKNTFQMLKQNKSVFRWTAVHHQQAYNINSVKENPTDRRKTTLGRNMNLHNRPKSTRNGQPVGKWFLTFKFENLIKL